MKLHRIIIVIIILLLLMHYKKYISYTDKYEIQQQELDYIDGNELYNQQNPLVITFIEDTSLIDNITRYNLYSVMSLAKKHTIYNTSNNYLSHKNEILFIRTREKLLFELVNPKYKKYFKKSGKDKIFQKYSLNSNNYSNVKAIDIVSREYNILFIPRHWLFKCHNEDQKIEIFTIHNIFTYLFNIIN